MNRSIEFKDVAHHYLTSGIRCHFYKVGKAYANGAHDGYATLNHAHLELMRGGHWIVVPELLEVGSMTDVQVAGMFHALDPDFSGGVAYSSDTMVIDRSEQNSWRIGFVGAPMHFAYLCMEFVEVADYLRDQGYDVHGLIAARKATAKEVQDV